ncbi:hypothetical protein [Gemmata sp.]|uniref:hypothetical protein n=1 Tax=Gemmata sp. TaxID=1914242 RepID=UPI003F6E7FD2
MGRDEMGGKRLLREARALRDAFPDADALRGLPVSAVPAGTAPEDAVPCRCRAALRCLRDEMLLVRSGAAGTLVVLDDEMARVERLLRDG